MRPVARDYDVVILELFELFIQEHLPGHLRRASRSAPPALCDHTRPNQHWTILRRAAPPRAAPRSGCTQRQQRRLRTPCTYAHDRPLPLTIECITRPRRLLCLRERCAYCSSCSRVSCSYRLPSPLIHLNTRRLRPSASYSSRRTKRPPARSLGYYGALGERAAYASLTRPTSSTSTPSVGCPSRRTMQSATTSGTLLG